MANAQNIQIKSSLDTNMILIGEQTKMSVDFQYPNGADVQFPILKDTIIDKIEILDLSLDTIPNANFEHYILNYTLTSFDSGYYAIPPQIIIDNKTGDTILGNPLGFAVNTYKIDSTNAGRFFDIKEPYQAPWTLKEFLDEYLSIILIVLLLIILVIVGLWYLKKREKVVKVEPKKVIPKEAAHIIAIRDLTQLKEKKLWQADRTKQYYVELSDIVRAYLENRFKIAALEQTSHEIIESIELGRLLNKEQIGDLKQILSLSDMAKFAKAKPLANENDLALKNAFELVEQTKLEKEEVESPKTDNSSKKIDLLDSKSKSIEKEANNE
jgi:hypothetical protein